MKNKKDIIRVIALVVVVLMLMVIPLMMVGCGNRSVFDTTWTFEKATIFMPNGEQVQGDIQSWTDFDGSDMIQVTIDGITYLTHSSNVILISE